LDVTVSSSNAGALLILLFGWTSVAAVEGVEAAGEQALVHEPALPGGSGLVWRTYVSPSALVATRDGRRLYIACATANEVATFDTASAKVTHRLKVDSCPLGLALSQDGSRLYVACASPASSICVIDAAAERPRLVKRIPAGHTAMAPLLSPDDKRLYVCNRFDNDVSVIDLSTGRELKRVRVEREPVAAALTPDGGLLVVANHLQAESANKLHLGAQVSVIDTRTLSLRKNISLTLGANLLRGVAISPSGRFAAVTHLRAMYWLPTTGVELGRMNGNAVSVLDLERLDVLGLVFLDQTASGGANPWSVAWTPDGQTIVVAQAGAHTVSLLDAPLCADRRCFMPTVLSAYETMDWPAAPLPELRPVRVRQRFALPGNGPRALALAGSQLYVANYFSDNLCRIDLAAKLPKAESLPLGQVCEPDPARKGEMLFNDGQLCFEGWQSCASCHDADGRTDALNWDLLNDGLANPKNTRSLVWAHRTGPAMALGVRTNAATAVRAGLHHILFAETLENVPVALDDFLQSLRPVPSPHLVKGRLSPAARRGERLFRSDRTGCVNCHPPPFFTDMAAHDVGTTAAYHSMYGLQGADKASDRFYSPALVELWRTAPYLHDGSAVSLRDVLTTCNRDDRHGHTVGLAPQEIDDLVEYLLSL
jgi:YVTN family beta-propeller protein